jgi:hypothetical protein
MYLGPRSSKGARRRLCEVQLQRSRVFPGEFVLVLFLHMTYSESAVIHLFMAKIGRADSQKHRIELGVRMLPMRP